MMENTLAIKLPVGSVPAKACMAIKKMTGLSPAEIKTFPQVNRNTPYVEKQYSPCWSEGPETRLELTRLSSK